MIFRLLQGCAKFPDLRIMFHFAAVGLAFFLALLLLSKRNKTRADYLLACWLFVMALHTLMFSFFQFHLYPEVWGIDMPLPLLHGPFLYLYTRALTGHTVKTKDVLIHFALPIGMYLYLLPFIFSSAAEKVYVYENHGEGHETFLFIRAICIPLSGLVYVLLSLLILRRHRKAIERHFSNVEKVNLAWLQYLIVWLGAIWMLVIFANDDWIFGATVVFIFFIGFFGIRQGVIFSSQAIEEIRLSEDAEPRTPTESIPAEKSKYRKSGLTPEAASSLHRQLTSLMATEKPFTNSELTLLDLAAQLNAAPNHVSQVINEREGKTFYDYINGLRVREFLDAVSRPESRRLTLFALAQECGFNSKSSFNRYFKKFTGQSPSEYTIVEN